MYAIIRKTRIAPTMLEWPFRALLLGLGALVFSASAVSAEDNLCSDDLLGLELAVPETSIVFAQHFAAGQTLGLASNDLAALPPLDSPVCLVKLLVGPGSPGPEDAPSTAHGVGVEVLLPDPDLWNHRYLGFGQGGFAGGSSFSSIDAISATTLRAAATAQQGFVTSASDGGHSHGSGLDGSFGLTPEGKLNWPLLSDWAYGALEKTALATKALIEVYYEEPLEYSYWNGHSTGGREGLMLAQRYPDLYDGLILANPALNWNRFVPGIMWAQIVMQQDLGGPIAEEKLAAVNEAAIAACDRDLTGLPDGWVTFPELCRYDPIMDPEILCTDSGGRDAGTECLSEAEAAVVNKIWYGPRIDSQMIDPSDDIGWGSELADGQLWFGYNRGTLLHNSPVSRGIGPAGNTPFVIGSNWLAIVLEDPSIATEMFENETASGTDGWKDLSYGDFLNVTLRSLEKFAWMNHTDSPDLRSFAERGGKIIHWHGLADNQIPSGGSLHYYHRMRDFMGGQDHADDFYAFYLAPGVGHGVPGGASIEVPVPGGDTNATEINSALLSTMVQWVEDGIRPSELPVISSDEPSTATSRIWCPYPSKITFTGENASSAGSFSCK